jgi:hypothetical protein
MTSRVAFRDRTLQRVLDFARIPVRVKQSRTAAEVLVGYVRVVAFGDAGAAAPVYRITVLSFRRRAELLR